MHSDIWNKVKHKELCRLQEKAIYLEHLEEKYTSCIEHQLLQLFVEFSV